MLGVVFLPNLANCENMPDKEIKSTYHGRLGVEEMGSHNYVYKAMPTCKSTKQSITAEKELFLLCLLQSKRFYKMIQ